MNRSRSFFRRLGKAAALGLLLTVLLAAVAFMYRDRLVQGLVRPLLVRELSRRFQVEATIDRLWLQGGTLRAEGVEITGASAGDLELERLEMVGGWELFSERRLQKLVLTGGRLLLQPAETAGDSPRRPWPEGAPFSIDDLEIRDGEIRLAGGAEPWHVEGRATLGRQWSLELKLRQNEVGTLELQGRGDWEGGIRGEMTRFQWRGNDLLGEPLRLNWGDGSLTGGGGEITLAELGDDDLRPLLALAGIRLPEAPRWTVRNLVLKPSFDGNKLQLAVTSGSGVLRWEERTLLLGPMRLEVAGKTGAWQVTGGGDLGGRSRLKIDLHLGEERLEGKVELKVPDLAAWQRRQPGLGPWSAGGAVDLEIAIGGRAAEPRWELHASAKRLSLPENPALPAIDLEARALLSREKERWRLSGGVLSGSLTGALSARLSGTFTAALDKEGWSAQLPDLRAEELSWGSADGLAACAGIGMTLQGEVAAVSGRPTRFAVRGTMAGGEVLYGAYYASLDDFSARWNVKGESEAGVHRLEAASVQIPELGELLFSGAWGGEERRLKAALDLPDLQKALDRHAPRLLFEPFPKLKALALAGALHLEGAGAVNEEGWSLGLTIEPQELRVGWGETMAATGVSGRLPLLLGTAAAEKALSGTLSWQGLSLGPLRSGPARVTTLARTGRLQLPQELRFDLAEGELVLSAIDLALPPHPLELAARLTVADVQLQPLTRTLEWPIMNGDLSADLGELHYRNDELVTAGKAWIEVFGGHVGVGNMRLGELFSPYPVFEADIDFSAIDLYRLTHTFAFGEMNGVIDGHIHDLRLFGAVPTRFEAALQTRKSGKRNISVKALNNLTILSEGGVAATLSRGIYRFIDFYRYRSIGIDCSLDNDLFRLRGTALEGSDSYLVYGGLLPPRIDVVTTPQAVSFREMVKRLKRLDRAGNRNAPL
ncbi:hypothetical protein DSOUD_0519 [Desulfuromonas soudanensis]|uniref:Dicarboxylate transport domain-containing protein n=1 Tax=Desulfuromonas soudanensis TaxID=1603606 RepID=A0A0M4D452_9BACT|nr:hypothetical protein [Desulfuromonas soudanensis]ALC15310.1 hypothetical protein DSOUD_0519 [Desulfuromonas soudanensis]